MSRPSSPSRRLPSRTDLSRARITCMAHAHACRNPDARPRLASPRPSSAASGVSAFGAHHVSSYSLYALYCHIGDGSQLYIHVSCIT
eukprot:scaffold4944_cov135-Isochrysis_galbana.AAC.6